MNGSLREFTEAPNQDAVGGGYLKYEVTQSQDTIGGGYRKFTEAPNQDAVGGGYLKYEVTQSQDTIGGGYRKFTVTQSQDTVNRSLCEFTQAQLPRFVRIQDTVNARISILVDTTTGFYNATKTINQFYELYPLEEGHKQKEIWSWTRGKGVKELIALISDKYQIENPIYDLHADTPNEYKGTYMCSKLYDSFLMWLDRSYGLDLLDVIEKSRSEKIVALTQERDEALDGKSKAETVLSNIEKMVAQVIRDGAEREEAAIKRADEAKFNLQQVEKNLTSEIRYVADMLKEKSIHSTMDPKNNKLVHNYVCLGYDFTDENGKKGRSLYHIAGQDVNVRKAMRKKYEDESHQWKEVIAMHYSANPIDLRNNIKSRIGDYKAEVVKKVNDARAREVMIYNNRLKEEIKAFNKLNPTNKRMFSNEKHVVKKISVSDIPIRASKLTSAYIENEFVSYDEYLDVVRGVDIETKKSPYQSEASDSDETKQE
jgi:KilA-N domain/Protein of unknown function (DUF3627)